MNDVREHDGFFKAIGRWSIIGFLAITLPISFAWLVSWFLNRTIVGKITIIFMFCILIMVCMTIDGFQADEDKRWSKPFEKFYYQSVNSKELQEIDSLRLLGIPDRE